MSSRISAHSYFSTTDGERERVKNRIISVFFSFNSHQKIYRIILRVGANVTVTTSKIFHLLVSQNHLKVDLKNHASWPDIETTHVVLLSCWHIIYKLLCFVAYWIVNWLGTFVFANVCMPACVGAFRYWWMRVSALAEAGDWAELEKFSKSKKPPIGMEVC